MMRIGWSGLVLFAASTMLGGCFSPNYGSGHLQCAPGGSCPSGFHCAASDNRCYKDGDNPPVDGGIDLSVTPDLASVDLSSPPDLTPVITATPPAAAWTCGGGGSGSASSGNQLNLSLGGTIVKGTAVAPSGAIATFGYFSSDTE